MNLSSILPPLRPKGQPVDTPVLLLNSLLAACRHNEFKRLVGWKGMAVCPRGTVAWTMKLRGRPGVYGLLAEATGLDEFSRNAKIGLYYFPEEDEPLLEHMSLAANLAATQPDYIARVRTFSTSLEWAAPFRIGTVSVHLLRNETALAIQVQALDRKICIAKDGVTTESGEWVIAPEAPEEDFPAHDITTDVFLVIGAAVSNSLASSPARYAREEQPSMIPGYTRNGERIHFDKTNTVITDTLVWGEDDSARRLASHLLKKDALTPDQVGAMPQAIASALLWKTHDLTTLGSDAEYAYAFDTRPRLIVLSGFLGAGKTTFLNQLLEYHASRDEIVAIIQNEVGQTGVDGKLLEGDDSIVEIDEGCVCCTLAGNLSKGIEQLKTRFNPRVIVLESTGLANPFNILKELDTLRSLARLDSVTTLVDAVNAQQLLDTSDIAMNQVKAADIILLNKCDLVTDQERASLFHRLRTLNSRAHIAETEYAAINPATLYDSDPLEHDAPGLQSISTPCPRHIHAMEEFTSRRFTFDAPLNREALIRTLDLLPPEVFRLKGIVSLIGHDHAQVVQYVAGRHELSSLGKKFEDQSFLVAIGKNMNLSPLAALQEAHT